MSKQQSLARHIEIICSYSQCKPSDRSKVNAVYKITDQLVMEPLATGWHRAKHITAKRPTPTLEDKGFLNI